MGELETTVLGFIDVLDRTRESNTDVMRLVSEDIQAVLARDNEVLLDLRNRIWRQFAPVLVDTVN